MNFIIYNNQTVSVTYNGTNIPANSSHTAFGNDILGFANDPALASDVQASNAGVSLASDSSAQVTSSAGISLINSIILTLSVQMAALPPNASREAGGHLESLDSKFLVDGAGSLKAAIQNFPSSQTINGSVSVSNFPSVQPVSGNVNANQGSSPWITKNVTNSIITPVALNALNATIAISTAGYASATFSITGTYVGQLTPEASLDGVNWFSIYDYNYDGAGAIGGNGLALVQCSGYNLVRLRMFSYTSGTAYITAQADAGSNIVQVWNPAGSYNFPVEASQADDSKPWSIQSVSNAVGINLNGLGQTFVISTASYGSVVFAIGGTWIGQLVAEASLDGSNWYFVYPFNSGNFPIGNDFLRLPCSGFKFARLRVVAYTSGTINVSAQADLSAPGAMVNSPIDGQKSTFSVSANINVPNSATDIFTISAGAGKTVKVLSIRISGTQNTAGNAQANLILRSSQDSGGAPHALTVLAHNLASSSAIVNWYSANPTSLGAAANPIRADKLFVPAPGTAAPADKLVYDFGSRPGQAITLRGSQLLALNLNGATLNGGNFNCSVEYTEE